jgi:hypothetical protein
VEWLLILRKRSRRQKSSFSLSQQNNERFNEKQSNTDYSTQKKSSPIQMITIHITCKEKVDIPRSKNQKGVFHFHMWITVALWSRARN